MFCPNCGYTDEKKTRSIQQNKAYFGLAVSRLADKYNCEKNIMHRALAGAYFGFVDVQIGGLTVKVPASTSGRTTKEFKEFFEYVQKIAAEVGVDIPSPNEPPQEALCQ